MKQVIFFITALSIVLINDGISFAVPRKPTSIGTEYPAIMEGVRQLGMGSAFLTMPGSDVFAQFYNPAAINDFEPERRYEVSMPMADFTPDFFELVDDLFDLKNQLHSSKSDTEKIHFFDDFVSRNTGDFAQFTTSMIPFHVRHKRYAAGFVIDGRAVISLRNQAFPNFEFKTHSTAGIVGGSALGFFGDSLQIGGNLKFLYRAGIEDQITTSDILVTSIKDLIGWHAWKRGFGVGLDAGIKYRLPFLKEVLKPTIAVTVFDAGNTRFTGDVESIPMSVSAGVGIFPSIGGNTFAFLVDFRELNYESTFIRKFHAGAEVSLPQMGKTRFTLRGGCNQGYAAFGMSGAWPFMKVDLAYYGEEAGQYTHSKGSYRFAAQFSFPL